MKCLTDPKTVYPREGYLYQIKGRLLSVDLTKTTVTSKSFNSLVDFSNILKQRSSEETISGVILIEDRDSKINIHAEIGNSDLQSFCQNLQKINKKNPELVEVPMTEEGLDDLIQHCADSDGTIFIVAQCVYINSKLKVFRILRKSKEPILHHSSGDPKWILKSVEISPDDIRIDLGKSPSDDRIMSVENPEYPEETLVMNIRDRHIAECIDYMLRYPLDFFNYTSRIFYKVDSENPKRMEFLGIQNGDLDQISIPKTVEELDSIPDSIINRFQSQFVGIPKIVLLDPDLRFSDSKHKLTMSICSSGSQNENFAMEIYSDDSRIVNFVVRHIDAFIPARNSWFIYYDKDSKKITGMYPVRMIK